MIKTAFYLLLEVLMTFTIKQDNYGKILINFAPYQLLQEIGATAKKNNLLMLLYSQLLRYNKDYFNNEDIRDYLKELKPIFLANASRCIKQEAEENNIISLLATKNIP